jgi:hypothetical protein
LGHGLRHFALDSATTDADTLFLRYLRPVDR